MMPGLVPGTRVGHLWLHRSPDKYGCGGTLDCKALPQPGQAVRDVSIAKHQLTGRSRHPGFRLLVVSWGGTPSGLASFGDWKQLLSLTTG